LSVLTSPGLVLFNDEQKEEKRNNYTGQCQQGYNKKLKVELNAADTIFFQDDATPYSKFQTKSYTFDVNNFNRIKEVKESKESRQKWIQ
jgi:hypothetical protein